MTTRRKPITEIGGGGTTRRCTKRTAACVDFLANEIWEGHKANMLKMGLKGPSFSVALDYLLMVAQKEGICVGEDHLTPENNLFLAIAD